MFTCINSHVDSNMLVRFNMLDMDLYRIIAVVRILAENRQSTKLYKFVFIVGSRRKTNSFKLRQQTTSYTR